MTRGKKKKPVWKPFVCCGETMRPQYRKGKPGTFNCRHCGNVRPQRVSPKAPRIWGRSPVEALRDYQNKVRAVLEAYPPRHCAEGFHKEGS